MSRPDAGAPPVAPPPNRPFELRTRVVAAVLLVVAGLGLAVVASRSGPPFVTKPAPSSTIETIAPLPAQTTAPDGPAGNPQAAASSIHRIAGLYVLIGAGLMFLALAAVPLMMPQRPRVRRRPGRGLGRTASTLPPVGPPRVKASVLAGAVEVALAALERGPVGDAIVACWVGLEDAAADAGTERLPSETSAELTERVLTEHRVTARTLHRLGELYREARYSRHALGDDVRDDARALFEQVLAELRGAP